MLDVGTEDALFRGYATAHRLPVAPEVRGDNFLRPLLQRMAQQISRFPAQGNQAYRPWIRLGFLDKPSPNAFADRWREGTIIGIHSGMLRSIFEATTQLQHRIGAFGTADSSAAPEGPPLEGPLGMVGYLDWLVGRETQEDVSPSSDEQANWRATNFISSGIQFAILHEFGHISNGHLGWLRAEGEPTRLMETQERDDPSENQHLEVRQFFEHEADTFAIEILIRSCLHQLGDDEEKNRQIGDEIVLVMLAFLAVVASWLGLEKALGKPANSYHPAPLDRRFALPMALSGLLDQDPSFEEPLALALRRCQRVLAVCVKRYPAMQSMLDIFSPSELAKLDGMIEWMRSMDAQSAMRMRWRL